MAAFSLIVGDAGVGQRRDGVFAVQQRLRCGLELTQFLDDGLPLRGNRMTISVQPA
jgi:hypothetical protein